MTHFDKQKLSEIVLYILNKTNGLDYYHLFKVIYFANMEHLVKYGFPMVTDDFYALPDGPVPTALYDSIKRDTNCDSELRNLLSSSIKKGEDDAYYMLAASRKTDEDYLSKADTEVLDNSIKENAYLPYSELKAKSHGKEWERAFSQSSNKKMSIVGIAKDGRASDDMIEYIKENLMNESALA